MTLETIAWEAPLFDPLPQTGKDRIAAFVAPQPSTYYGDSWTARAFALFQRHPSEQRHLDSDFADLVSGAVAQENSCRFCYAATRMQLRVRGLSPEQIREVEQKLLDRDLSEKEHTGLDYVRKLSRSSPLPAPSDEKRLLDSGWSQGEIHELA